MAKFLSDLVFLDQAKTSHKPSGKQSLATDADAFPSVLPTHAATSTPSEEDPLDLVDHLERLQRLHADGFLSEEEFTAAKVKLLD